MRPRDRFRAGLIGLVAILGLGFGPPEIVKIRVPSSKVSAWFPPGSDLQVLPPDQFEAMVKAATDRPPSTAGSKILRARHAARWESGVLIGSTELDVESPTGLNPALVTLEPWSPALTGEGSGADLARSTREGLLALKLSPSGPRRLTIGWRLRARSGSAGDAFALSLPELDLSSLTLDLPSKLIPEGNGGSAIGPEPGPEPGRSTWRLPAARGRIALRLRDRLEDEDRTRSPGLWLEGPTRIDLGASPANWTADWTLDESAGAPRRLTIELDPGLELLDVVGDRVASFRIEAGGPPTRVTIRLEAEGPATSKLTIRAIARPPIEGIWPIPSARPIDGVWLGGLVSVRLDTGRVLQSCVERSGRRLASRAGESIGLNSILLEPDSRPGPVAELTFRKPMAEATVGVRGLLRIADDIPRLEAAMTWTSEKGRVLVHAADLPSGWTPDRVSSSAGESIPWHSEILAGGGTRVLMLPPAPDGDARTLTMTLGASNRGAGVTGPIDLPRVRPSPNSGRVSDETWVAVTAGGFGFRPILGRGIAWIDPPDPTGAPWLEEELSGSLAWRWLVDDAEARANRFPIRAVPSAEVRLEASIHRDQVHHEWTLALTNWKDRTEPIAIHLDDSAGAPDRWRASGPGGSVIEARPLDRARRTKLGLPQTGLAFELVPPGPTSGPIEWKAETDQGWTGSGRVPLLRLSRAFRTRGLVTIRTEEATRLEARPTGLTPIHLERPNPSEDPDEARQRVSTFRYDESPGQLEVETIPGVLGSVGGVVTHATLTTRVHPRVGLRHRLSLRIAADTAREIVLTMPEGVALDRVRREGQPVAATPDGRSFRVAIPSPSPGRGSTTLTLDYRTEGSPLGRLEPARFLPGSSMPCLGFVWEVVAPDHWTILERTTGLVESDPRTSRSVASRILGVNLAGPSILTRKSQTNARATIFEGLDKIQNERLESESNLGDWLVKLDSGPARLMVDRLALASSGWGPGSKLNLTAQPSKSVEFLLSTMGLVAEPIHGAVLITTRLEVPPAADLEADPSDRFQSAARWRGEPTPRALSSGESPERITGPSGWRTWRLVTPGWPASTDSIAMADVRESSARGWILAALTLVLGLGVRHRPARLRAIGIGLSLGIVAVGIAWTWPEPWSGLTGVLRGLIAVLAIWLGRSLRTVRVPRVPSPGSALTVIPRRSGVEVVVGIALMIFGSFAWSADPVPPAPILAILPFDGLPDPSAKPDRVVMLLSDHERLRRLGLPEKPPIAYRASIRSAGHRVTREEAGFVRVESRLEVEVEGDEPTTWSLPIGPGLELSATVDGRATPLAIGRDGLMATIPIESSGVHEIRFRRLVPILAFGPGGERIRVPISRAAFARLDLASDDRGHWVDVPESAGSMEVQNGGIGGRIGPAEFLEVRWFSTERTPSAGPRGPVEASMSWDARPVGDCLRVRLSHSDPEGASTIRLSLEPGLLVRGFAIPNLVGVRSEGTSDRPEWVARIDPPWPRDTPIEVDFWRPIVPGPGPRKLPRVETLDARRFSGIIGFRRPADWSGRLEPADGAEVLPEASFARTWGATPEERGLILAGAVRFGHVPALSVATGPLPVRRTILPKVTVELEPGRLVAVIEAVLSDRQGRSFELEVSLPTDFRVVRVEAVGLADWRRIAREGLRLQFDGTEVANRSIRISGSIPAPADPVMVENRSYMATIPWPRWSDAVTEPGTLIISGPGRLVDPGDGVSLISSVGPGEAGSSPRTTYRVEKPGGLVPIRWSSPRARVAVSVRSELTIDPESVHWTALLDCDLSGGPAESLQWKLPADWAEAAVLELNDQPISPVSERRGDVVTWKIQPTTPLWGRAKLVIRSRRAIKPGVPFAFPEVSPQALPGRGSLGRYDLAIANLSGRPIESVASSGLQLIDASRYRSEESPAPPGAIDRAYRVTGEGWSLRITVGGGPIGSGSPGSQNAQVARARIRATIGPSGEVNGLAHYDLKPRPGPFLALSLPGSGEIPWASVDGLVAPVIRDGAGRWLVSIRDRQARQVQVCWDLGAVKAPDGKLDWPAVDPPGPPSLIRVFAPGQFELSGLKPISDRSWNTEQAEWLADQIIGAFASFDRSSRRDRGEILRDLIDFEVIDRELRSTVSPSPTDPDESRRKTARDAIAEASQAAGLADLVLEAKSRVGQGPVTLGPIPEDRADLTETIRVRQIGQAHDFQTGGSGENPVKSIDWKDRPASNGWRRAAPWWVGLIGLSIAGSSGLLIDRSSRFSRRSLIVGGSTVSLILLAVEPIGALMILALIGLGRILGGPISS